MPRPSIRLAGITPWIPLSPTDYDAHRSFWRTIYGNNWDDVPALALTSVLQKLKEPDLRTLDIDIRIQSLNNPSSDWEWADFQIPLWVTGAAVLSYAAGNCSDLQSLRIRMTPQAELFTLVEELIRNNPDLHEIVVDVDSALLAQPPKAPTLNITNFFIPGQVRMDLSRFVVRAPSCPIAIPDSTGLFAQFSGTTEIRIVTSKLQVPNKCWHWAMQLFQAAGEVETLQVAASQDGDCTEQVVEHYPSAYLETLWDLTLDLPRISADFLRLINAPELQKIRVRSMYPLHWDRAVHLPVDHFPALSLLKIHGEGPILQRFKMIGVARDSFVSLTPVPDEGANFNGDLVAYLRPGARRGNEDSNASPTHDEGDGAAHDQDAGNEHGASDIDVYGADGSVLVRLPGVHLDGIEDEGTSSTPGTGSSRRRGPRPGYFYKPPHGGVVYFGTRPVPSPLGGRAPWERTRRGRA
ncbi:hypothetical protein CF319_g7486 [Tilletia indica]|nr:hypothetical protein CF319_g7486 [Tilletia indica]